MANKQSQADSLKLETPPVAIGLVLPSISFQFNQPKVTPVIQSTVGSNNNTLQQSFSFLQLFFEKFGFEIELSESNQKKKKSTLE